METKKLSPKDAALLRNHPCATDSNLLTFGLSQIGNNPPLWTKWIFRIIFLLTTITISWLAATNVVPEVQKYEITLFLKVVIDPLAYGLSKMFGIEETSLYSFERKNK